METRGITRRNFLATTAAGAAALSMPNLVFASGQPSTLRVGVVGCGGRGTGAARDCWASAPGIQIVALGDVFPERLASCTNYLKEQCGDAFKATPATTFVGLDAYKKVIDSDVDLVILATPPGFRPDHIEYAIQAGKHVFTEKPVAVDGAGIQRVFDASDIAKTKNLAIVAGTQRRHESQYMETMARIHDGAIGDITSMACYWNQGGLWMHPREEAWSDVEWQLKNWLYFTWLSGDHITEQHVHNIDVCNWAMKAHPVKAVGLGGRQSRIDPAYGHVFDHFAIEYTYENGVLMNSYCRQQDGTAPRVSEFIVGTKGTSNGANTITGENAWRRARQEDPSPYVQEHTHLINSIREGKPLNEGRQVAESTLTAIMGRLAAYTGQEVTWEQALATKSIVPANLDLKGSLAVAEVAVPGKTKLESYM